MLNTRTITTLLAAAALALAGTGCGDDDEDTDAGAGGAETTTTAPAETGETTETTPDKPAKGDDDRGTEPVAGADVTLTEFEVDVSEKRLQREGVYTLTVANEGETTHALESEGPNGETETEEIAPGESAELDVYFVNGTYRLYCPIGDHEQRGMVTRLKVRP